MYQALYRKYRPQTFDDVVGQRSITETLKNQLITGKLSHAYLFTGTRGTGKTTCAKVLAKAVNCEHPVNGNPCNECAACRGIDAGSILDVQEIDAASNNGVGDVRLLRDDAIYTPSEVKMRVYIIDEVHMLSTSAFNALLKIIEEPPAHLLFILATTELHKVPATILSRCQRFSFRRLSPEDIAGRLGEVAHREGISLEEDAAGLLARLADGAMRDGLSLLDQCASAASGAVTAEEVRQVLGLVGEKKAASILRDASNHDASAALREFDELYRAGKDTAAFLDELCALSRDLLLCAAAPESGLSMLSGGCTAAELRELSGAFSPGELLRITRILQDTAAGFSKSADRRIDTELCLLELCSPSLTLDAESLNARLSKLEEAAASGRLSLSPAAAPTPTDDAPPPWDDSDAPPDPSAPAAPVKKQAAPPADDGPAGFWADFVAAVRAELKPPASGLFVAEGGPISGTLSGDTLELRADSEFAQNIISRAPTPELLQTRAAALLGKPVRIKIGRKGELDSGGDRLNDLIAFGREHENITVK